MKNLSGITQSERRATGWTTWVAFLVEAIDFSVLHSVHIGSGSHLIFYSLGTGECVELYIHSSIRLHSLMLN
jgi:hypothetical protein